MVHGIFEAIDHYEGTGWFAKGWAFEPERPDESVALELWWENGPLLQVVADRLRPDLKAAGMGAGRHAFEVALPDPVLDGKPHLLHMLIADRRVPLASSPRMFTRPRFHGAADVIDGQFIQGWIEDHEDAGCAPTLDILIDGALLSRIDCMAGLAGVRTGRRHPFRFVLPLDLCDGSARRLDVRVSNTGYVLKECPATIAVTRHPISPALRALDEEALRLAADIVRIDRERARNAIHEIDDIGAYARWLAVHEGEPPPPPPPAAWSRPSISVIAHGGPERTADLSARLGGDTSGWELLVPLGCEGGHGDLRVIGVDGRGEPHLEAALRAARGEAVVLLPRNGQPHPTAIAWLRNSWARGGADAIYTDEDRLDTDGVRRDPHFKPDWDPERAMATGYAGFAALLRRDAALAALDRHHAQGLPIDESSLVQTALLGLPPPRVHHLPRVLFHRTDAGAPSAPERAAVVAAHLRAAGSAAVATAQGDGTVRVRWPVPDPAPAVTLIIPTRDRVELLRTCIDGIRERTTYAAWSILVVDNESREPESLAYLDGLAADPRIRVHRRPGAFNFSAFNNEAVAMADTPLVGLVNNDIEVIAPDWLDEMVSLAVRPEVGAVGAKLLHPDGAIQHGGVIVGFFGVADNAQRAFAHDQPGYQHSATVVQNASAVTAACLICRTEVYRAVGGLDADSLPIAFSDVDFCLKVREQGLRVLWTPHALLYHRESASRGIDRSPESRRREEGEASLLARRWHTNRIVDPFYSPNLDRTGNSHCRFAWPHR